MLNGQDADMIWDESTDIEGVADGLYQLKVELSNADHTPITPYAGDLVYITVDDGLWSVVMGAAAHRSIDEGRAVHIAEYELGL